MTSSAQGPVALARGSSMEHDSFLSEMLQHTQLMPSRSHIEIHCSSLSGSMRPSPEASVAPLSLMNTGMPRRTASSVRWRR